MQKGFFGGFLLFAAFLLIQSIVVESEKVVFCYWGTWSVYRAGNAKFEASNIDPNLCTHVGYSFFGLGNDDRIMHLDPALNIEKGNIAKTIALKEKNPKLKVLAVIGGWNEGSTKYSAMASSPSRRATFINSVIEFIEQHGFDGLDLDWEYPAQRGGSAADRDNYVTLLKELKEALKTRLLTIAVAAGQGSASISYDIPNLAKHVDFINLMTYDFTGSYETKAGFNSPLDGAGGNNVKAAINYWIESGAPANKLVLGLPAYGRSFTLANSANNDPGAPTIGAGNAGPLTAESSFLGYNEICQYLKSGWTRHFDNTHLVPFAFNGNQWVGYDDKESVNHKIDYIKSLNLAGGMVWSIETDDFRGTCGEKFPLLRSIKNGLSGGSSVVGTTHSNIKAPYTEAPNTKAPNTKAPNTKAPNTSAPNTGNCQDDGKFVNPSDCSRYYECANGHRYEYVCPSGLHFDQANGICNWPAAANCHL